MWEEVVILLQGARPVSAAQIYTLYINIPVSIISISLFGLHFIYPRSFFPNYVLQIAILWGL